MAFPICRRGVSAEDGDDVAAGRTPLMLPQRKNAQIPLDRLRGGGDNRTGICRCIIRQTSDLRRCSRSVSPARGTRGSRSMMSRGGASGLSWMVKWTPDGWRCVGMVEVTGESGWPAGCTSAGWRRAVPRCRGKW